MLFAYYIRQIELNAIQYAKMTRVDILHMVYSHVEPIKGTLYIDACVQFIFIFFLSVNRREWEFAFLFIHLAFIVIHDDSRKFDVYFRCACANISSLSAWFFLYPFCAVCVSVFISLCYLHFLYVCLVSLCFLLYIYLQSCLSIMFYCFCCLHFIVWCVCMMLLCRSPRRTCTSVTNKKKPSNIECLIFEQTFRIKIASM